MTSRRDWGTSRRGATGGCGRNRLQRLTTRAMSPSWSPFRAVALRRGRASRSRRRPRARPRSRGGGLPSPRRGRRCHGSRSIPAGAQIDGRIQVGDPVARAGSLPTTRRCGSTSPPAWCASTWRRPPSRERPPELDGLRLRHDRGRFRLADGLRERRPPEDRPGRRQGGYAIPRIGTRRRAVTEGSVWVANQHNGSVQRIDPATNRVVATIPVGPIAPNGPQIMSAGPGGVWVGIQIWALNVRVDHARNSVGRACRWTARWRATAWRSGSVSERGPPGCQSSASIRNRARSSPRSTWISRAPTAWPSASDPSGSPPKAGLCGSTPRRDM